MSTEPFYYLYAVNDQENDINLAINLSAWGIDANTLIIVELVGNGYFGEVYGLLTPAALNSSFYLRSSSLVRLTVQTGTQTVSTTAASSSCTLKAGTNSAVSSCSSSVVSVGTSNSTAHESTNVALLKFNLNQSTMSSIKKTVLNMSFVLASSNMAMTSNMTVMIVGLTNYTANSSPSWTNSGFLSALNSGTAIDHIYENFFNWSCSYNPQIAGHLTISSANFINGVTKLVDVSEYVSSVIAKGLSSLTFVVFRPFRHEMIRIDNSTDYGTDLADDLSNGAVVSFSSASSANPPTLIHLS